MGVTVSDVGAARGCIRSSFTNFYVPFVFCKISLWTKYVQHRVLDRHKLADVRTCSQFPVDFQDIHQAGSLTPEIIMILFTRSIGDLGDTYRGLLTSISIDPGLP